jgi:predicted nucleic acid-binding protein
MSALSLGRPSSSITPAGPAATETLASLVEDGHDLYTCDVVSCESLSRGDPEDLRHIEVLLNALEYVATTPTAARWAGESKRRRHAGGNRRSLGDALIAGIATDLGATVVTRNRPDFARQGVAVLEY